MHSWRHGQVQRSCYRLDARQETAAATAATAAPPPPPSPPPRAGAAALVYGRARRADGGTSRLYLPDRRAAPSRGTSELTETRLSCCADSCRRGSSRLLYLSGVDRAIDASRPTRRPGKAVAPSSVAPLGDKWASKPRRRRLRRRRRPSKADRRSVSVHATAHTSQIIAFMLERARQLKPPSRRRRRWLFPGAAVWAEIY